MSPTRPNPTALLLQQQKTEQLQQPQQPFKSDQQQSFPVKTELDIVDHKIETADEEMPTDLSMAQHQPTDLSLIKNQHQIQPTDLSLIQSQCAQQDSYHIKTDEDKSDNISVV